MVLHGRYHFVPSSNCDKVVIQVSCMQIGKNRYCKRSSRRAGETHIPWVILLFLPSLLLHVWNPMTFLVVLFRHRHRMEEKKVKFMYGTLHNGYKNLRTSKFCHHLNFLLPYFQLITNDLCQPGERKLAVIVLVVLVVVVILIFLSWEVIVMIRKVCNLYICLLTAAGTQIQALTGIFVNMIALVLHMQFRPYICVTEEHDTLQKPKCGRSRRHFALWAGLLINHTSRML